MTKLILTIKLEYLKVVSKVLDNFNTEGQKSFPTEADDIPGSNFSSLTLSVSTFRIATSTMSV